MGLKKFISEFWKDNKFDYFISCLVLSVLGFVVYASNNNNYSIEGYLSILPFLLIGMFIFALMIAGLMYKKDK